MNKTLITSWPIVLATVLFVLVFKFLGFSDSLDRRLYDNFIAFKSMPAAKDITLIAIDEKSISALGKWPWPRDAHVQLLQQLQQYQPQLVAFDILFIEKDQRDVSQDQKFVAAVRQMSNVILPVYLGNTQLFGSSSAILSRLPYDELSDAAAGLGHVQLRPDSDGVTRSVDLERNMLAVDQEPQLWPHFSLVAYNLLNTKSAKALQLKRSHYYIPFTAAEEERLYTTISYVDVLLGLVPEHLLKNRIIFVGATAAGLGDNIVTPITGDKKPMSGVESHINTFQAIRTGNLVSWVDKKWSFYLSLLLCALLATIGVWLSARELFAITLLGAAGVLLLDYLLLQYTSLWFPMASFLLGLVALYPLWSFYGLSQAVSFLKDELSRVEHATPLFSQPQELGEFLSGLNSFLMSGHISAWWVNDTQQQRLITAGEMPFDYQEDFITEGKLELGAREYRWFCVWLSKQDKQQYQHYLNVLPDFKTLPKERLSHREFLTASIDYLRDANQQARVVYNMARKTLKNIQGVVLVVDSAGRILFANDSAKKLFELANITVENKHVFHSVPRLFEDESVVKRLLNQLLFAAEASYAELKTKDERFFLMQADRLSLLPTYEVALITMTNITLMKRLQEARAEALQFLSHDLRSPMISILALLEQAKEEGSIKPETIDSCVRLARKNLGYANNYLQIVRTEEVEMSTDICDAVGVFDTAIASVYVHARDKNIKINTHWPEHVLWVEANIDLLSRALQNLIGNAIKYSAQGSDVNVALLEHGDKVGFQVKDSGIGIPAQDLPNLFKGFNRASNAKAANIEGTGLGLRFVEVVSSRHHGSIDVESEEGQGSCFTLWLPKAREYVQ